MTTFPSNLEPRRVAQPIDADRPEHGRYPWLRRLVRRRGAWLAIDCVVWAAAVLVATGIRYLYVMDASQLGGAFVGAALTAVLHGGIGVAGGLYDRGRVRGSYDELVRLLGTVLVVGIVFLAVDLLWPGGRFVPGTVPVIATALTGAGTLTVRLLLRAVQARHRALLGTATPVVVVGDGDAARQLLAELRSDDAIYRPVAVAADDGGGGELEGVRVVGGGPAALTSLVGRMAARAVILADPAAPTSTVRAYAHAAAEAGTQVLVLPTASEMDGRPPSAADLRPVRLTDLLGRREVEIDEEAVADTLRGRTVLVTGAGGGIGSELCRQAVRFGAHKLVLVDRDESKVSATLLDLIGRGFDGNAVTVLVDVQDADTLTQVFTQHAPEVVFHAASVHNKGLLEQFPVEAWRNNVLGTRNVLEAASSSGALIVVNVSGTDADSPTTVLGFSHLIGERLVAACDERSVGRTFSVRVGETVESGSSVVRVFELQVGHGGPITLPAEHKTAPFMQVGEVARLVLQCAALSDGGDTMVLDPGEEVPLEDVAHFVARLAGRADIEVKTTSPAGEDEVSSRRTDRVPAGAARTWHPLVRSLHPRPLDCEVIDEFDGAVKVSATLLRYLALGESSAGEAILQEGPEALDWSAIEREWQLDEVQRDPSDAFASALLDLRRDAAAQQGRDVERIVAAASADADSTNADGASEGEETEEVEPIYLSKAVVGPLEEKWVLKALRSGYVAPLGPMVDEFERRVAERVGVKHALALSSGTAALHLLLMHVGAKPGTYVVLPTMTFAATANAIMYTGATPYFVDVQESDANIDVDLMLQAVDQLHAEGKTVAAVVTVDLYGRCCDYSRIVPELEKRGVPLVEDAAEALGASHHGTAAGSFGIGAALSFNGNKIMTTSGGGMLLSNDGDLAERARYLSTQARMPVPWYEHAEVGYNYRMSNIVAGLGIAQLTRLDGFIARRRAIRDIYEQIVDQLPGTRILSRGSGLTDVEDNCWLTSLVWSDGAGLPDVNYVVAEVGSRRIEARHLWAPLHAMPLHEASPHNLSGVAQSLFARGINLPGGVDLTDAQIERVASALLSLTRSEIQRTVGG